MAEGNEKENDEAPPTLEVAGEKSALVSSEESLPCSAEELKTSDLLLSPTKEGGERKHSSLPHGVKLCSEASIPKMGTNEEEAAQDEKFVQLSQELRSAQTALKAKDEEVEKLKGIRQQVEEELDDLTSSLFQEAHKMVKEAKMKEASSEKSLKETRMQLEGLQAEVAALKALLITSTPSRPNLGTTNGISLFKKHHKRTPSHNHLLYGRSEADLDVKEQNNHESNEIVLDRDKCEMDPLFHSHFASWREEPSLNKDSSLFLKKIYTEDIIPCLSFQNETLVRRLEKAIEENSIWLEPLPEKFNTNVPKECALLQSSRVCHYRMSFAYDSDEWFDISQLCRDRIAAVCEFLNYLRYIKNGLVKASIDDSYWEIIRLRHQMGYAKLGISLV